MLVISILFSLQLTVDLKPRTYSQKSSSELTSSICSPSMANSSSWNLKSAALSLALSALSSGNSELLRLAPALGSRDGKSESLGFSLGSPSTTTGLIASS